MTRWSTLIVTAAAAAASALLAAQRPAEMPVYVVLVSTIEDHLNDGPSLERVDRALPMVERYRREYPQYRASWLVRFSGTVSDRVAETDYATRMRARLAQHAAAGLVEIGYDGTDEPTFVARPRPNFRRAKTAEDRWLARVDAIEWFLSEGKDPVTGAPLAGRVGGLRRTLDVFGSAVAVRGVTLEIGGDPELAHVLRGWGLAPVLPGFGENTAHPGRTLAGYRGGTGAASALLSPDDRNAPEVFWQDGLLALSEFVGPNSRIAAARDGAASVRTMLDALDRSRPHIVQVRLGHPAVYIKPGFGSRRYQNPLEFSYENPRSPSVPVDALRSVEEMSAEYAKEDEALRWLVTDYFPTNPGSRFLSIGELQRMAAPASPERVANGEVTDLARELVESFVREPLYLPPFVRIGDRYLSLADSFSALVGALAREQAPPTEDAGGVAVAQLYGPRALVSADERTIGSPIARADVRRACQALAGPLSAVPWSRVPANAVPSDVPVGAVRLSAAQFLLAMADAVRVPDEKGAVVVRRVFPVSALGESFPGTRPIEDRGTTWTLKPAVLRLPEATPGTAARDE